MTDEEHSKLDYVKAINQVADRAGFKDRLMVLIPLENENGRESPYVTGQGNTLKIMVALVLLLKERPEFLAHLQAAVELIRMPGFDYSKVTYEGGELK